VATFLIIGDASQRPEETLSILSFLRFSLESILRNWKRSVYAIVGIVIALSLIAGSWIAVDSSGIGLMRAVVNEVPVDFIGSSYSLGSASDAMRDTSSAVAALESVGSVDTAVSFISVSSPSYMNSSGGVYLDEGGRNFSGTLVFLSNSSEHLLDSFKIVGELPGPGTVAIPKDVADSLDVQIGDNVTCSFVRVRIIGYPGGNITYRNVTYYNVTYPISSIWTQQGFENPDKYWFGSPVVNKGESGIWLRLCYNPVIFNLEDYAILGFNRSGFDLPYTVDWSYFIWIDRGQVVNPANLPASIDELRFIQQQLAKKMRSFSVTIYDSELISPLKSFDNELQGRKPLFLALSLPVLALGVYLSVVGVDLGVSEHSREAAILKSRGASNRQVFQSLIVEASVLGVISGIAGLLLGVLMSRLMLGAGIASQGGTLTEATDFLISSGTVILCILVGVALMLLSSYTPFKRISATAVSESLHEYSPTLTQSGYLARIDIMLLSLCALGVVTAYLGFDWPSRQGFSWIAELLVTSLFVAGTVLFYVLPFLLSLSLVRLLTRGSTKLYSKFTWLVKPWTGDMHYLVNRNIVRNPRRASNLCSVIALALAFGLFISVTMESTIDYEREKVHFEVGSDIKLDTVSLGPSALLATRTSMVDDVVALPGVEHAAGYSQLVMNLESSRMTSMVALNPNDYLETVRPSDFFFIDGGSELIEELSDNGTVLLTKDYADRNGLLVGDVLPTLVTYQLGSGDNVEYFNVQFEVVVAGLVKSLPGLDGIDTVIDLDSLSFIPEEGLTALFTINGVFIDVAASADPHVVANDATELLESLNLTCTSTILQDQLDALDRDPYYASLVGFLHMEYALSIVIMTVGVGLLVFVAVRDREKELACIMARGSSGGQIRKILMGESITLMALGLVVGAGVGMLTAYLFNTLSGEDLYTEVERNLVFSYTSLAIVLSSIAAILLAALIATARASEIKLAEVLRIRGG